MESKSLLCHPTVVVRAAVGGVVSERGFVVLFPLLLRAGDQCSVTAAPAWWHADRTSPPPRPRFWLAVQTLERDCLFQLTCHGTPLQRDSELYLFGTESSESQGPNVIFDLQENHRIIFPLSPLLFQNDDLTVKNVLKHECGVCVVDGWCQQPHLARVRLTLGLGGAVHLLGID